MNFNWYVSAFDHTAYKVHGHRNVREIQHHHGSPSMLQYLRKIHNGDSDSFERNVLSVQGGVVIRWADGPASQYEQRHRWTPDLYDAFVEHLRERDETEWRDIKAMWDSYDVPHELRSPLNIPKPMYWSTIAGRFLVEPWFTDREQAGVREAA